MTTVLVVDDEWELAELLSITLSSENTRVVSASDGEEAIARALELKPDLVFVDFDMPHLNGIETTLRFRSTPELARTPIVMVTGAAVPSLREDATAAGVDAFLTKPFSPLEQISLTEANRTEKGASWRLA